MKKIFRSFPIAGLLLAASCGAEEPVQPGAAVVLTGVVTESLRATPIVNTYEVPGTVISRVSTVAAARTGGYVTSVTVDEGDRVQAGQVLVEIDSRDAAVQVRRAAAGETEAGEAQQEIERAIRSAEFARTAANANRDLAAATLERYRSLRDRRSVSPQEFDEVQTRHAAAEAEAGRAAEFVESLRAKRAQVLARIDQAKADQASAGLQLGYTRVVAPIGGVVTARHIEPGMLAAAGAPLIAIEDNTGYQLEVAVEEARLPGIRRGQRVMVQIDAAGPTPFEARVSEILPVSAPLSRTVTVRLDLPGAANLQSGLFGRASFPSGQRDALTIPESAIVRRGQLVGAWLLEEGIVRFRLIRTGKPEGDRVEILSGLNDGDLLILAPRANLVDGAEGRR